MFSNLKKYPTLGPWYKSDGNHIFCVIKDLLDQIKLKFNKNIIIL